VGIFRKNDSWWIDYYANGRRYREKIGDSKTLAENVLRKRKLEIAENKFLDVKRDKKIKFEDFADEYLNLHSKVNNRSWATWDLRNIILLKKIIRRVNTHHKRTDAF